MIIPCSRTTNAWRQVAMTLRQANSSLVSLTASPSIAQLDRGFVANMA
jgi:hypothetical protein